jgi:hypothetical protein
MSYMTYMFYMSYKHEIQILEEQINPQKAHHNQLIQECFKENIFLADGVTRIKSDLYETFVNQKGRSIFTAGQISFIKSLGGYYDAAFDAWMVKLEKPRTNFSSKYLAENIIPCGVCGEEIIWDNNRELRSEFINAKDIGKTIRPRHVCKRNKVVYIH